MGVGTQQWGNTVSDFENPGPEPPLEFLVSVWHVYLHGFHILTTCTDMPAHTVYPDMNKNMHHRGVQM